MDVIEIRHATSHDQPALSRLAALDSAAVPLRPALVAECHGELVAALSLRGGAAIADPFRRTQQAVELLQLRARQIASVEDGPRAVSRARLVARRLPAIP